LPATAFIAHRELKLKDHCLALRHRLGLFGLRNGLWVAAQFIATDRASASFYSLANTISKLISPQDKSVAVLFGDAGSATALEFDGEASSMAFVGGSDGSGAENLCVPGGAFRAMPCDEVFAEQHG